MYNLWFDKAMLRWAKTVHKTTKHRIIHACLFELGLLVVSLPIISWWLRISLWKAFVLDIGLVVFYLVFAYVYNLAYDKIFPIQDPPQV